MYHKLEETIKKALNGIDFGNNEVVVKTTNLGEVEVRDLEEVKKELGAANEELEERNKELEEVNEELEEFNKSLIEEKEEAMVEIKKQTELIKAINDEVQSLIKKVRGN